MQGNQKNCIKASENGWYNDNAKIVQQRHREQYKQWNDHFLKVLFIILQNIWIEFFFNIYRHCDWKLPYL